jgi:hypothetical protein
VADKEVDRAVGISFNIIPYVTVLVKSSCRPRSAAPGTHVPHICRSSRHPSAGLRAPPRSPAHDTRPRVAAARRAAHLRNLCCSAPQRPTRGQVTEHVHSPPLTTPVHGWRQYTRFGSTICCSAARLTSSRSASTALERSSTRSGARHFGKCRAPSCLTRHPSTGGGGSQSRIPAKPMLLRSAASDPRTGR